MKLNSSFLLTERGTFKNAGILIEYVICLGFSNTQNSRFATCKTGEHGRWRKNIDNGSKMGIISYLRKGK